MPERLRPAVEHERRDALRCVPAHQEAAERRDLPLRRRRRRAGPAARPAVGAREGVPPRLPTAVRADPGLVVRRRRRGLAHEHPQGRLPEHLRDLQGPAAQRDAPRLAAAEAAVPRAGREARATRRARPRSLDEIRELGPSRDVGHVEPFGRSRRSTRSSSRAPPRSCGSRGGGTRGASRPCPGTSSRSPRTPPWRPSSRRTSSAASTTCARPRRRGRARAPRRRVVGTSSPSRSTSFARTGSRTLWAGSRTRRRPGASSRRAPAGVRRVLFRARKLTRKRLRKLSRRKSKVY